MAMVVFSRNQKISKTCLVPGTATSLSLNPKALNNYGEDTLNCGKMKCSLPIIKK